MASSAAAGAAIGALGLALVLATPGDPNARAAGSKKAVAAPTLTQVPSDPSPTGAARFVWTHPGPAGFRCSIDSGPWHGCTSPYAFTVDTSNNREHSFSVRAQVGADTSPDATYKWKVTKFEFSIAGSVSGLVPGSWRPITLTLMNPHPFPIYVTELTVAVTSAPGDCLARDNVEVLPSPVSGSNTVAIPAGGSTMVVGAQRPQIRLTNTGSNQDACKGATFGLSFTGLATK